MISKPKVRNLSLAAIAIVVLFLFSTPAVFASGGNLGVGSTQNSPDSKGCASNCIYIGDYLTSQVTVINASTDKIVTTIALPSGTEVFGVTYVASTHTIWVGTYTLGYIYVYSTRSDKLIKKITVSDSAFMTLAGNGMMYVAQFGLGTYQPINTTSYALGTSITACAADPEFLAYNNKDGMIYAPARTSCYDLINPSTNKATKVTLGTAPTGVAVNQMTGDVYITDSTTNQTYVVSGSKLITTINSTEFKDGRLWGAIYSPKTNEVYIVASGKAVGTVYPIGTVIPITSSNKVEPAITVGQGPDFGCYIPSNKDMLITNTHGSTPGNVSLISHSDKVIKTITLGSTSSEPYGCAED
jgi:glutamine cyclotransferase